MVDLLGITSIALVTLITIVTGLRMNSSTVTNLFDGDPLALQSGDQLAGFAGTSATGNFTLTLSTEEFFDPVR